MTGRTFRNQRGSALLYVLVLFVVILVIGLGVWLFTASKKENNSTKPPTPKANSVAGGSDSQAAKPLTSGSDDQSLAKDVVNLTVSISEGEQNLKSASAATNDESEVVDIPTTSDSLQLIKTRANGEIDRRLARLEQLDNAVRGSTRLSSGNKSDLTRQVKTETTKLTALQSQINTDSDAASARIDAQSTFNEYRVYALVISKVWQIRIADDQQVLEDKLNTFSGKLQTRINAAGAAGKDVGTLQQSLNDLIVKVQDAQRISGPTKQKLLPMESTDFNNDHTILTSHLEQLKGAHVSNKAAQADAKVVTDGIRGK